MGPLCDALRLRATTLTDLKLDGDLFNGVLSSVDDFTGLRELLALLEACHMLTNVQIKDDDEDDEDSVRKNKVPEAVELRNAMVSLLESRGGTMAFGEEIGR